MAGRRGGAPNEGRPAGPAAMGVAVASQSRAGTDGGMAAEEAATHGAYVTNPDGSHHITITAGAGTQCLQVLEMLPWNVRVAPGDTVTWDSKASPDEIHTVTFPRGHGSDSVDPFGFPPMCEPTPSSNPDTLANPSGAPNTW